MKVTQRFVLAGARELQKVITAFQIKLISLAVGGLAARELLLLFAAQAHAHLLRDVAHDVVLHGQQIGELALILFAPQARAVARVGDFDADEQLVADFLYAPAHHGAHFQFLACLHRIDDTPLISEHRAARHHAQVGQTRKIVNEAFGQAVGQITQLRIVDVVGERQHRDRINRVTYFKMYFAGTPQHRAADQERQ